MNGYWPNMRTNFKSVAYGDSTKMPEGEWGIYRFHYKGSLTENWSPTADEAIGGSKFKYQEYITRFIWGTIGSSGGLYGDMNNIQGQIDRGGYLVFMNYDISGGRISDGLRPQINDSIFTILGGDKPQPPKPPFKTIERFYIHNFEKSRDTYGQSAGWILNISKDVVTD